MDSVRFLFEPVAVLMGSRLRVSTHLLFQGCVKASQLRAGARLNCQIREWAQPRWFVQLMLSCRPSPLSNATGMLGTRLRQHGVGDNFRLPRCLRTASATLMTSICAAPVQIAVRPVIVPVATRSISSAMVACPVTAKGSRLAVLEYLSSSEGFIVLASTWPMDQLPKRRSAISS